MSQGKREVTSLKVRWRREIRGIISASIFAGGMAFILRSWEMAWMITLSLGFHELGHGLAVSRFGIDWELGFSPLGAWTKTPLKERQALSYYSNSLIHLAGPFFSLILSLAFIILYLVPSIPNADFWLRYANFNALVCLLNLLPMGNLSDGGKFVRKLFSSANETLEQRLLALVGILPLTFVSALLVYQLDWARLLSLLGIVLWFVLTMLFESKLDDPTRNTSQKAMNPHQSRDMLSGMIIMLLISMGIVTFTPFWLNSEHIIKMIAFFSSLTK